MIISKKGQVTIINHIQDEKEIEADFMCIVCVMLDRYNSKKVANLLKRSLAYYIRKKKGELK